jgi:hypothetical protein
LEKPENESRKNVNELSLVIKPIGLRGLCRGRRQLHHVGEDVREN